MLEILNAVQDGTKSPTQAQSELLLLYSNMAGAIPLLEHLEYMDNTAAQGEWLHKYTKKRYYLTELTGKYGYSGDDIIKQFEMTVAGICNRI